MTDEMTFKRVKPGTEVAGLIAAYGEAVDLAQRVRVMLVSAGFDTDTVRVVASLTDTGAPVVYLTALTDPAARSLRQSLHGARRSPDRSRHPPPG